MIAVPFGVPCWQLSPCWHSPSTSRAGKARPSACDFPQCSHFSLPHGSALCSVSGLRDLCRPQCVSAQGMKAVKRCFEPLKELMELGRASSVWQVIPKLCLPLLPSPQLPAWVLSVFFYVLALFFPALPPVAPLWLSKGTPAPARPGRRKAQVGSSPLVLCLPLHLGSVVSQYLSPEC